MQTRFLFDVPLLPAPLPAAAAAPLARPDTLLDLVALANEYASNVRARATQRAYTSDYRSFAAWCEGRGLTSLPAEPATVAVYLAALAKEGKRPSTIQRALAGIAYAHRAQGLQWSRGSSAIGPVMRGIRRRHGVAPAQKAALGDRELAALVGTLGANLVGLRDRALLTLGWMGAFRRSELVALRVGDVERTSEGLVVHVGRSKNDQEGRGGEKAIPYALEASLCPVRALGAWLEAAGIATGPLFRAVSRVGHVQATALCDRSVARIVQRASAAAGLDPATVAGHSLRAGFATTAARRGKSLDAIMRQTLHRSERVARTYLRHAGRFDDNAAAGLL